MISGEWRDTNWGAIKFLLDFLFRFDLLLFLIHGFASGVMRLMSIVAGLDASC